MHLRDVIDWLIIVAIFMVLVFLVSLWVVGYRKSHTGALESNLDDYSLYLIQGNSISGLYAPTQIKPITYGALIGCLEQKESSGNPDAIGKAGECGCLQFMPSTWELYCVKRYGFPDDIWSCNLQRLCADLMIADGLLKHWTTYGQCVN